MGHPVHSKESTQPLLLRLTFLGLPPPPPNTADVTCGWSLVAELELAHLEELFQVGAEEFHDHGVELCAPRAARPDLEHLRESRLECYKLFATDYEICE